MINSVSEINNKNIAQIKLATSPTNFRGATASSLERTPDSDLVEFDKKTRKKSKLAKWLIGIGGTLGVLSAAGLCLMKHDSSKIAKLCKEKIVLSKLPEHIEFKEAKTVEEGLKYAKEVLGIQKFEGDFSLDAINYVNKGITDVSNAYKGNLYIPSSVLYNTERPCALASADLTLKSDSFGRLYINKNFFDNEYLNQKLYGIFFTGTKKQTGVQKAAEETKSTVNKTKENMVEYFRVKWSERFQDLLAKFKESPNNLSVAEKRELYYNYTETCNAWANRAKFNPTKILDSCKNLFAREGIVYDYEAISKLPLEEQKEKVLEICKQFHEKTGSVVGIPSIDGNQLTTIYHEMGHLQDMAKNLENLTQQNSDWGRIKQIFQSKGKLNAELDSVEFVANRWNKISDGQLKKLMNEKPDLFKAFYPDLYEHINNEQIQKTAAEVSIYSTKGIGEFIAEVHAGLIGGKTFSKEVIDLYKKYNGPIPAAIKI